MIGKLEAHCHAALIAVVAAADNHVHGKAPLR